MVPGDCQKAPPKRSVCGVRGTLGHHPPQNRNDLTAPSTRGLKIALAGGGVALGTWPHHPQKGGSAWPAWGTGAPQKLCPPSPAGSPHSLRVMGGGCRGVVPTLYPLVSSLTVGAVSVFCPFCAFSFSCPHLGGVVRWSRGTPAPQAPPVLPPADPTGTLCSPPTQIHLLPSEPPPPQARNCPVLLRTPLGTPHTPSPATACFFPEILSKPLKTHSPDAPPPTLPWCQDPHFALRNHPKTP